jgi:hypothetical protein
VRRLIHLAGADTYLHLSAPEAGQSGFPQLTAGTGTGGGPAAARTTARRRDTQQRPR